MAPGAQVAHGGVVAGVGQPGVHGGDRLGPGGCGQEVAGEQLLTGRVEVGVPGGIGRPGRGGEHVGDAARRGDGPARVERVPPERGPLGPGDALGVEQPHLALAPARPGGRVVQVPLVGRAVDDTGGVEDLGDGHGGGLAHAGAGDDHHGVLPGGPDHAPAEHVPADLEARSVLSRHGGGLGVHVAAQARAVTAEQAGPAVDVDALGLPAHYRYGDDQGQGQYHGGFAGRPPGGYASASARRLLPAPSPSRPGCAPARRCARPGERARRRPTRRPRSVRR